MQFEEVIQRRTEGLCEVVFVITATVEAQLDTLNEEIRDTLMDRIEGSRGLFWQHVLPWAKEYHAMWQALSDAERDAKSQGYIGDIYEFAIEKFKALANIPPDVVSIQVVPVIHHPRSAEQNERAEPQFDGPTGDTTCWGIYTRDSSGMARWQADAANEAVAMLLGRALAVSHNVEIEPQPWKEKA